MKKLLLIFICLVLSSLPIFAQTSTPGKCPSISVSVSGPSGIMGPGDAIPFKVSIAADPNLGELKYKWTISSGEIRRGNGTTSIDVLVDPGVSITASVEIEGLPLGCMNQFSDNYSLDLPLASIRLDEFDGALIDAESPRYAKIVSMLTESPNSQLYAILSGTPANPSLSIRAKREIFLNRVASHFREDSRITFLDSAKNDDKMEIWLVPAGASPPTCDDCGKPEFQKVSSPPIGNGILDFTPIDQFGWKMRRNDEGARLDNLAVELGKAPANGIAYIVFATQNGSKSAQERMTRMKKWLFDKRKYPNSTRYIFLLQSSNQEAITFWILSPEFHPCRDECIEIKYAALDKSYN